MKKRRIFIAINLPEEIKKKLVNYQANWPELPIKWIKKENLHITLAFLGYLSDEELLEVCKITRKIAEDHESFSVNLNKICYGPPKKMPPRMVWVSGERSEELVNLKKDLENSLAEKINFSPENRAFSLHITLGRMRQWEFRRIESEDRPKVDEDISLNFPVNSIEAMESQLKRSGVEYTVIESSPLAI